MLFILSFLFAFLVLCFLIYAEPSNDFTTSISKDENSFEFTKSETQCNTPIVNFKSFIIPDELGFLMDIEENSN